MADKKKDYKALSAELDGILAQLENPATDIDDAIELYRRGQKLTQELERYLKNAQNQINKLSGGLD